MKKGSFLVGFVLLAAAFAMPAGCGSSGTVTMSDCPGGPDCSCTSDKECACVADGGCSFDCQTEGCKLACGTNGTCEGACAKDCDASCPEGSVCTIDLGQSGDLKCTNADCELTAGDEADISCDGGSCRITCTARCDIGCTEGTVCEVKCAGDSDFQTIEGSMQCK